MTHTFARIVVLLTLSLAGCASASPPRSDTPVRAMQVAPPSPSFDPAPLDALGVLAHAAAPVDR